MVIWKYDCASWRTIHFFFNWKLVSWHSIHATNPRRKWRLFPSFSQLNSETVDCSVTFSLKLRYFAWLIHFSIEYSCSHDFLLYVEQTASPNAFAFVSYFTFSGCSHVVPVHWILLPASWILGFFITQQYEASACAMSMSPTRCLSFWESPGRPVTPDFLSSAACLILFTPPGLALSCSPGKLHTIFAPNRPKFYPKIIEAQEWIEEF